MTRSVASVVREQRLDDVALHLLLLDGLIEA